MNVWSQNIAVDSIWEEYDQQYGLDIFLYSGKKNLVYYMGHYGHPFWKSEEPIKGDLVVEGKRFKSQMLSYNIEKQEFVLTYFDYNKGKNQLIIVPERIDSVLLNNVIFIRNSNPKLNSPFVQLIYSNKIQCYKTWRKDLQISKKIKSPSGFAYTKEQNDLFLLKNDQAYKFYNKKSFLQFFDKKYWSSIKKYISQNNMKFRNISDKELSTLVKYCEDLTS
jgi:hypothetical protein